MADGLTDVHITCTDREALMASLNAFASGRTDVALIGEGVTRVGQDHFVVIEFDGTPDEDFLRGLEDDDSIVEIAVFDVILVDEVQEVA